MMKEQNYDLVHFEGGGVSLDVNVSPQEDTVWLSQEQMANLFGRTRSVISRHLQLIFSTGELDRDSICSKNEHIGKNGKIYPFVLYNLDVIISVGYRVNSKQGILFRKWATSVLKEYLLRGYAVSFSRTLVSPENFAQLQAKVSVLGEKIEGLDGRLLKMEGNFQDSPPVRIFYEGSLFDAYAFLSSLMAKAKASIILVDSYADEKALAFFRSHRSGVAMDLYLSSKERLGDEAYRRFAAEYGLITLHETVAFHDRYLILDHSEVYAIGASLNNAGRKTFGVYRIEDDQIIHGLLERLSSL
jgi:hypothetical protein